MQDMCARARTASAIAADGYGDSVIVLHGCPVFGGPCSWWAGLGLCGSTGWEAKEASVRLLKADAGERQSYLRTAMGRRSRRGDERRQQHLWRVLGLVSPVLPRCALPPRCRDLNLERCSRLEGELGQCYGRRSKIRPTLLFFRAWLPQ